MRILPVACACFAIIAVTATASVVTAKVSGPAAAQVMHERHEGMETIGKNFKTLHRQLDASSPDVATVRASASTIANLSKKASGWFPAGTGPDIGKTGAKPEIWQNPQDFAAKLSTFQKAAQVFNAATSGSDVNAMKARYADLAGTCKACHDKYRTEMHH
jgi:cytochrome c556